MRAITVDSDQELTLADHPDPEPGPGEVVLRVVAAGINRADLLQRQGHYPPPPGASDVLGLEVSGVVDSVGADVHDWRPGEQACALLAGGGYAEKVAVPAGQLLPVPDGVSLVDAASLPESACTAWSNLVHVGRLRPDETVLIHGGSGGVGVLAVQIAAAHGARVVTTAGGPERAARCARLGADVVVDHRAEDFVQVVKDVTDGRGADVILDVIGGAYLEPNLRALATGGRLVVIGFQKGRTGELDLGILSAKRASVAATTLRSRPVPEKAAIVSDVCERVWPWVASGAVKPVVHARFPLAEAARAQEAMAAGESFGKVLLVVE